MKHLQEELRLWGQRLGLLVTIADINDVDVFDKLSLNEEKHLNKYRSVEKKEESRLGIKLIKELLDRASSDKGESVQLEWDKNGAPTAYIEGRKKEKKLISISHSNGFVVAMTLLPEIANKRSIHRIGVDIEFIPDRLPSGVLEMFSCQEKSYISLFPVWVKTTIFAKLWTRKEAIAKATNNTLNELLRRNVIELSSCKDIERNLTTVETMVHYQSKVIISVAINGENIA